MTKLRVTTPLGTLLLLLGLFGCGGGGHGSGGSPGVPPQRAPGILYVKTNGGPSRGDTNVTTWRFAPADTIANTTTPVAAIDGGGQAHGLANLQMALDVTNDRLYFTSPDAILRFLAPASTIPSGSNTLALGVVFGSNTQIVNPNGLAVDAARDVLYVTDNAGKLLVFRNFSTYPSPPDVTPSAVITAEVSLPGNIFLDQPSDTLYVCSEGGPSVTIFHNASALTTGATPSRLIKGANTTFDFPRNVFVDRYRDILYVADDDAQAICVFTHASTVNGDEAPARRITGANTMLGTFFDLTGFPERDELYVANDSPPSILVFSNASTADGNMTPTRVITHPDLEQTNRPPNCIAIDTTR
jgi:sugar lactone lactonase YvrE